MGSRSQPILRLLVLGARPSRKSRQRGYAMAVVLVSVLIGLVSAATLSLRGTSGQAGSFQLSASRQARDAAESGITAIIGELNRRNNRRLLVSASAPETWGSATDATQRNPCLVTTLTPTPLPLGTAVAAGNNSWKSAGGNGEYVLRSVRYAERVRSENVTYTYPTAGAGGTSTRTTSGTYDNNGSTIPNESVNLRPAAGAGQEAFGHFQLEVIGRVVRANREVARATVVKDYQVIPKCCDRSFAGPVSSATGQPLYSFGNDRRLCPGTENLGMLFGLNGGILKIVGQPQLQELSPTLALRPLTALVCIKLDKASTNCGNWPTTGVSAKNAGTSITVPVVPVVLNPSPVAPDYGGSGTTTGTFTGSSYVRVKADGSNIEVCPIASVSTGDVVTLGSGGCTPQNFCEKVANSKIADYHCNLSNLELSGTESLVFDTSRGTIALFFNTRTQAQGQGQQQSGGVFSLGGNVYAAHVYCNPAPAGTSPCNTKAPASEFDRLSFVGNQDYNRFVLGGGIRISAFFVFFPKGSVELNGSINPVGAVWSKNLTIGGDFTSAAPAANCLLTTRTLCNLAIGGDISDLGAPRFDWLARSPVSTRVY